MKVCVDLDGTVSADPSFYKAEMRGLMAQGAEIHVLTGNPQAHHVLAQLGMVKGRDFSRVVTVPKKNIGAVKIAYMRRVGATHLIDNRKRTCKDAIRAGFTAHHHMSPKKEG